jgi:hypothetical protein
MIGYANYVDKERKETTEALSPPAQVKLDKGPGMLPLLPVAVKGVRGSEVAKQAQEIIRSYFLRHYREWYFEFA